MQKQIRELLTEPVNQLLLNTKTVHELLKKPVNQLLLNAKTNTLIIEGAG